jgi:DNA-binding transcriptional ArsR family regulator
MRPLVHPALEDISLEGLLHALADPVRFAIFAQIASQQCSASCSAFQDVLTEPIPKSTLSQHFRILREAGLIRSERRGVEVLNSSRCEEIDTRFPGLLSSIVHAYMLQSTSKAHSPG